MFISHSFGSVFLVWFEQVVWQISCQAIFYETGASGLRRPTLNKKKAPTPTAAIIAKTKPEGM
jgi:hypothetical protein